MKLITRINEETILTLPEFEPKVAWLGFLAFFAMAIIGAWPYVWLGHFSTTKVGAVVGVLFLFYYLFFVRGQMRFTEDEVIREIRVTDKIGAYAWSIPYDKVAWMLVLNFSRNRFYFHVKKHSRSYYLRGVVTTSDLTRIEELLKQRVEGLEIKTDL